MLEIGRAGQRIVHAAGNGDVYAARIRRRQLLYLRGGWPVLRKPVSLRRGWVALSPSVSVLNMDMVGEMQGIGRMSDCIVLISEH